MESDDETPGEKTLIDSIENDLAYEVHNFVRYSRVKRNLDQHQQWSIHIYSYIRMMNSLHPYQIDNYLHGSIENCLHGVTWYRKDPGFDDTAAMLTLHEGDDEPEGQYQLVGGDLQDPHASCGACHYRPGSHVAQLVKLAKRKNSL